MTVSTVLMRAALSSDTMEHKIRLILSNLYGQVIDKISQTQLDLLVFIYMM